jgi:NAD(P)-dependent dehydrogenase (short-subunit alcohol dehydrogenase family)
MKLAAGTVAVITGAASGIGLAMAEAFAGHGLAVALLDVEQEALKSAEDRVWRAGSPDVLPLTVDVRDAGAVTAAAAQVSDQLGTPRLVCSNAGVLGTRVPLWEQPEADWKWTIEVNLMGTVHVLRAFLPAMVEDDHGHLVITSSIAGLAPMTGGGNTPYAASKHALVGLAECLRMELDAVAPNVGITVLCPGQVPTRIRQAERNRPAEHGGSSGPTPEVRAFELAADVVPAEDVADQVVAAVQSGQMYLLPNPGTAALARARIDRVLADLPLG